MEACLGQSDENNEGPVIHWDEFIIFQNGELWSGNNVLLSENNDLLSGNNVLLSENN